MIELMANSGGYLSEDCCARQVARPLLEALAGLHALGIIHRHLKPEHLLCSNTSLEIVDFTDAAHRKQHCLNCRVGDLHYMAPEVLSKPRTEDIFHQVRKVAGLVNCKQISMNAVAAPLVDGISTAEWWMGI